MASYTPTNWVAHETLISADRMNNIESGIAALYPQEVVIAPEQTVTLTSETSFDSGAPITLADGVDIDSIAGDFEVVVAGTLLAYQNGVYLGQLDSGAYAAVQFNPIGETGNYSLGLMVVDQMSDPSSAQVVPGDYTVKVTTTEAAQESGGILLVKNNGVGLDKTAAEIWSAMQTGLVLVVSGDGVSNLTIDLIRHASHESGYTFSTTPGAKTFTASGDDDYPREEQE